MNWKRHFPLLAAGFLAGSVNGLFGAGGGMILVPLLALGKLLSPKEVFPSSVCIIAPISILSLFILSQSTPIPWLYAYPYLLGSAGGGLLAGVWGQRIPVKWLHKALGIMILWGGLRFLC